MTMSSKAVQWIKNIYLLALHKNFFRKSKVCIKSFFSKCDQIRSYLSTEE